MTGVNDGLTFSWAIITHSDLHLLVPISILIAMCSLLDGAYKVLLDLLLVAHLKCLWPILFPLLLFIDGIYMFL